jgi:hypothetical protein
MDGERDMIDVVGVTHPIPKKYTSRFFNEGKTVFLKPASCFTQLVPGMKFVIYQSQEDTGFVGEGKIEKIVFADEPSSLIEQFGDQLFLTEREIQQYLKTQERWKTSRSRRNINKKKKWMAIKLIDIKKYPKVIKPAHFVPVGGQYMRK